MFRSRLLRLWLLSIVCVTALAPATAARAATADPVPAADAPTLFCPVSVVMRGSGYVATVVVVNAGSEPLVDWSVQFTVPGPAFVNAYAENATLTVVGTSGTLTPAYPPYTNTLAPGASAIMRFSGVAFTVSHRPTGFNVGGTPCQVSYYNN
ncbi:cellulose binding domain-containing protein [Phytohabitans sp. ZYX-F-186]|uniref:Cellulose binding domain-containing protein n=1 Tax=Phytohabitans maris TaxID=3071409 RepID=A0ABU0ZCR9_9ACTN|nr:cellulose binding domain-containing protein [Phytohabitans sp. ZYX-F-186]MDQ7904176.1 cellulose binding domain-containing protein [Phytohabitans sp. ZYX-F-186]